MTKQQAKALAFIDSYIRRYGYSPSYVEIGMHLEVSSKSGVYRVVKALVKLGKLRVTPNAMRSMEVVDPVSDTAVALVDHVTQALMEAHSVDDGDGPLLVASESELRATLMSVLAR